MTKKDEARYIIATALKKIATKWDLHPEARFKGNEVAEVLRKTADDLLVRIAA